jgi:hypothetical protein
MQPVTVKAFTVLRRRFQAKSHDRVLKKEIFDSGQQRALAQSYYAFPPRSRKHHFKPWVLARTLFSRDAPCR